MELSEHSVKDAQWAFDYFRGQLEHKGVRNADPSDSGPVGGLGCWSNRWSLKMGQLINDSSKTVVTDN